jgi:PAS domain S-box-containing protein
VDVARQLDEGRRRASRAGDGRLWLTFGPAALLLGVAAAALILTSDYRDAKAATLAVVLPAGWAFVAAGLIAWSREPDNRVGKLMVATGFAWLLVALSTANTPLLFALGLFVFVLPYAFLLHLFMAYPSGRLPSRAAAAVVALAYLDVTLFRIPSLLFWESPDTSCPDCPTNPLLVADEPSLATAADIATSAVGMFVIVYGVVGFARRWRSASPRGRRVLAPVLLSGAAVLTALLAVLALDFVWDPAAQVVMWLLFALLLTVPAAFLAGLLRTRLAAADAGRFLIDAPAEGTPAETQEDLRKALGDPTLELAYWLPERNAYVDIAGNSYELPPDGEGRMTTPIAYEDRPVAALIHDESLRHEPGLVEAVVAAARVALEKDRLGAELRARLDELQRERDFVATVVNTAPAFFCVVDLDGRIIRFNTAGELIAGVADDERVRGRPFWEVFAAPEDAEPARTQLLGAAAADGSTEIETALAPPGGGRRVLAWSSAPIVDAQGVRRLLVSGIDVTERTHQERELERERDFSHAVTDTTPSFLVIVDDEGRITEGGVNKACEDVVGRLEAELVGQRFVHAFIPPDERADVIAKLGTAGPEAPVEHEGRWLGRDGTELWVAWSLRPLRHDRGRRSFLVCGTDITERKRQEYELQRERNVLNTIADTAPGLMLIVDQSGRLTEEGLNAPAQRVLGHPEADVASRDFIELVVAPDDVARARAHFERSVAAREPTELDSTWVTRTGDRLRVAWSATWLAHADDGVRDLFLVCGTDVTERVRHAEALQRERDFINTVANATPSLICVIDRDGRIATQGSNWAFEDVLGYGDHEVGGLPFCETFIAPGEREDVRRNLDRVLAGGASFEQDNTWLTKGGDELDVAWSCTAPRDFEERGLFLVCGVDVTERKRQEDALRASRARIVGAADAERRRLERNLHDGAQQRLVTLSLTLRLAESRLGADSDAARLLRGARDELAQALDELRDLARGIHPAVLSDHGLGAALDALASRVPVPVEIDRAVGERLPEPVEVAAYYVVSESLANVQKYARATHVTIGVGRENGYAIVEVRDDGVGGADASAGSGLRGLVDRVEALGGRLEIVSASGAGTTVRAHIPI